MQQRRKISATEALERLEALCARSEQCSWDLRSKLHSWGLSAEDADKVIDSLAARRFIDDRRFCRAFVRDKVSFAHWGKLKIRAALSLKHVDKTIISEAIDGIDQEEYVDGLRKMIEAKSRTFSSADTKENRIRLLRFAASRGFEPGLISRVLQETT